jgi:threonine synthase
MVDMLTGFLNKMHGTERISKLCARKTGALMILDLDNFKLVNDLFGHEMGLPIKRFIAANNANDVFFNYLQTGKYEPKASIQTLANAMDVGDPSNFARIYDLYGKSH